MVTKDKLGNEFFKVWRAEWEKVTKCLRNNFPEEIKNIPIVPKSKDLEGDDE